MALSENIEPDDAIINAGDKTARIDMGIWTVATLKQDWNPRNTGGTTPLVFLAENKSQHNFQNTPNIAVWTMDETSEPVTITYSHTNERLPVQIDCYTRENRRDSQEYVAEVIRILEANKTDTLEDATGTNLTGRTWFERDSVTHYGKVQRGWYRWIIGGELHWRFREVSA